jgi:hypothetical protein
MKLSEIAQSGNANHTEIKQWLYTLRINNYTIRPDGTVDVDGDVCFYSALKEIILPVQFGKVSGKVSAGTSPLLSLHGFPQYIGGDLFIHNTHIKSLSGIEKIINEIHGGVYINPQVTHILGLLLIPGITGFGIDENSRDPLNTIMNKYRGTGDILSAQDELIDAGYKEQARL